MDQKIRMTYEEFEENEEIKENMLKYFTKNNIELHIRIDKEETITGNEEHHLEE
jgi:hypothetical protein